MIRYKPFLLLLFVFATGACTEGFKTDSLLGSQRSLYKESDSTQFIPASDKVVSDCEESEELCIYLKNPVFQESKVISQESAADLRKAQKFSVTLTGIHREDGVLSNGYIEVLSTKKGSFPIAKAVASRGFDESGFAALHLNTYYWINRAHEYLKKNIGSYPTMDASLKVYVDDAFDGWSYQKKSIHLNKATKSALSGEVALLLFGESQLGVATEGKIYQSSSSTHQACAGDPVGCCITSEGCSQALVRGVGDAFVALLFEDALGVGEFHFQDLEGQSVCGKSRNPAEFIGISFNEAFSLCPDRKGAVLPMGLSYAGLWVKASREHGSKITLKVFLKHLEKLDGNDTITSAIEKVRATCSELNLPPIL